MIFIDYEWINILSILFFALSTSFCIVGFDIFMTKNFNKNYISDILLEKFEDKYIKEVNKLEEKNLSEDELNQLKNSVVLENTPMGNIILFYYHEKEKFYFYPIEKRFLINI